MRRKCEAQNCARAIPGTIVNEVASKRIKKEGVVRIGHPAGVIEVEVGVRKKGSEFAIKRAAIGRTARRIMEGYVYVRTNVYQR